MARDKNRGSNRTASQPSTAVNSTAPIPDAVAQDAGAGEVVNNMKTLTVSHKNTQKNGIHTFTAEGLNGSIYFNKSVFPNGVPANVTITIADEDAAVFATPGVAGLKPGETVTPERAAKALEKATKMADRLAKATERATKAKELADRLAASLKPSEGASDQPAQ